MKNPSFKLIVLLVLLLIFALTAKTARAAVRCETYYGGEVCVKTGELQINKQVWDPEDEKFVDNMGLTDYRFAPGEEITFKLKIKNVGDETFAKVNVQDTLPELLELSSGELSFEISDLSVDKTEEREFKVRAVPEDRFPKDVTVICDVRSLNKVEAWSEDERDESTAQVCLERKVLAVEALPPTGPKDWLIILPVSLIAGVVGIYLLRFSKQHLGGGEAATSTPARWK